MGNRQKVKSIKPMAMGERNRQWAMGNEGIIESGSYP